MTRPEVSLTGILCLSLIAYAQTVAPQPQGDRPAGTPGRPPAGTPGPWDNDVSVYRVDPNGPAGRLATFERAGVSTLARLADGRLVAAHQHFPADSDADFDKVAVRFSKDDGTWWTPPQVIRLKGLAEGMRFPFDPTLVPLPDGRIRLYFTSLKGRQFDEDLPAIYSAISTNAIDYVVESGRRFSIPGRHVIDCAVVLHDGVFHLYAPDNGPQPQRGERPGPTLVPGGPRPPDGVGYHATSRDGLTFTRENDVKIDGRRRWLGNAQSDGRQITFFGTGDPTAGRGGPPMGPPGAGGVWMATSRNGEDWQIMPGLRIQGADPGAVATRTGGWIVSVTGPPRPRSFRSGSR